MKNKPLTKQQRRNLIDAWAAVNCLHSYLQNPKYYSKKYNPSKVTKEIFQLLDTVVAPMKEDDL